MTDSGSGGRLTRRRVLQVAGVGTLGAFGVGTAGAKAERHIVGIRAGAHAAERAARSRADSVHRVLDFGDIGKAVAGRFSPQALDALRKRADVRYVEVDGTMEAIAQTLPWGVDRVDAEKAHDAGHTGDGADVAIIDTGIDSDHPDLRANLGAGQAFVKAKGPYAEDWDDDNGHGTHCAGIADAVNNDGGVVGVSTAATLHAVKVLDDDGSGSYSDVAAGLEWVADQGYDVGSLSLGGPKSSTIRDACRYAYDRGVMVVAAAGNDGSNVEDTAPATYQTVMAVSATDQNDNLASFSNYGDDIEIAAPGVDILSTFVGGGYETLSGTSMACPHVSGAAGQVMAQGLGHEEARTQLKDTAEDVDELSPTEEGAGLLDVEAAVGGSTDSGPSVSWVNPADGETVSGTITVQIDASDSEDSPGSLDVTYRVGSASYPTTYNSTSGYYEDSWDSTGVSDGDYTLEAVATDSAGNTSTSTITVTTENTESAPAVDSLSMSEVETSDDDAEFDASWQVSDADGNLSSADLVLTQASDGATEDDASVTVSGDTASGTTRVVAAGDDGSGNGYTVELTVTDANGNTASDTASATETEPTSTAPTIDSYSVTEAGSPNPHAEITADWAVGDADGDLSSVVVEVSQDGSVVDSATHTVSGSSASGSDYFEVKHARGATFDVTLTVTDSQANAATETERVSE